MFTLNYETNNSMEINDCFGKEMQIKINKDMNKQGVIRFYRKQKQRVLTTLKGNH